MKKTREYRNEPSHLWSTDFQQGCQENSMGERQCFQQTVLRQLDNHMQKNEVEPLPHTTYKK